LLSEVCYVDYCEYGPDLAPGVLHEIDLAMRRSKTDLADFRAIFMSVAEGYCEGARPQDPGMWGWNALEKALRDRNPKLE